MKKLILSGLVLVAVLTAGCTGTTPLTWVCPDGTEVYGGPSQCPESSFCKGTARCFNGTVTRIVDGDTIEVIIEGSEEKESVPVEAKEPLIFTPDE